ncbi:hypothetical protein FLACOL7796_04643 [Flavobacterium collinsii]|uniref:Uncharacterized protein n=1 Tax=Flavobacterium collinsii TaxID=1114861 RepID=A0ABM8KQ27_9FLAO|nr:hypothetical protein FLACOL7796_04643 [Flavobacterium collinsii]
MLSGMNKYLSVIGSAFLVFLVRFSFLNYL